MIPLRSHYQRRSTLTGIAVGGIALLLSACGTGPIPGQAGPQPAATSSGGGCTAANAQTSVTIDAGNNLKFSPATACLKTGGTVTWKNTGNILHTTTDTPSLAASAADSVLPKGATPWDHQLPAGGSFSLKLTVPGTYRYFCKPHETLGMVASITVVS
ncbi:MAG TPA: plastocyanin/azurin family copper-binding protein [Candidatus Dormibacteraeota bacterium]|nr:plastocyanin/azurin family copper-binding protein [Candidatus Dormibacteraeota bacterium]